MPMYIRIYYTRAYRIGNWPIENEYTLLSVFSSSLVSPQRARAHVNVSITRRYYDSLSPTG